MLSQKNAYCSFYSIENILARASFPDSLDPRRGPVTGMSSTIGLIRQPLCTRFYYSDSDSDSDFDIDVDVNYSDSDLDKDVDVDYINNLDPETDSTEYLDQDMVKTDNMEKDSIEKSDLDIENTDKNKNIKLNKSEHINLFLKEFFDKISTDYNEKEISKKSKYHDSVFDMLVNFKDRNNDEALMDLQIKIEELTTQYDDLKTLYHLTPDLIKRIIIPDKPNAKDFILNEEEKLTDEDRILLREFDHYTLEGLTICVLASVFHAINESPAVRVSTLIEHLTLSFKNCAKLLIQRNTTIKPNDEQNKEPTQINNDNKKKSYNIGSLLVGFLSSRDVIRLTHDLDTMTKYVSKNKNGSYFYPKLLFAVCNFDLDLLPIKLSLPMVYPPLPWKSSINGTPNSMSDICGGYLNTPTNDLYIHRYNLLSSRDINHFSIIFDSDYKRLIDVINSLQCQAFEVNSDTLDFYKTNYDKLVKSGLLKPKFLASLNVSNTIELLRESYIADPSMIGVCKFHELVKEFMSQVQCARYESFVINLASAYDGYKFYLPAFLDFRGRIYRAGVLHFHERDLARSLIVFSNISPKYHSMTKDGRDKLMNYIKAAAGFHFKKFSSYIDARRWFSEISTKFLEKADNKMIEEQIPLDCIMYDDYIKLSVKADNPFQFLSKVIAIVLSGSYYQMGYIGLEQIPIFQDASASAYQIMSIFLLDRKLGKLTNLIPSDNIRDIYTCILEELKEYLVSYTSLNPTHYSSLTPSLVNIICERLTRKLIKTLFMPLIYGKSLMSMSNDIMSHYNTILNKKECMNLASLIQNFFKERYKGIMNLMELIKLIGWVASKRNKPVYYGTPYFTTIQDYMKSTTVNIPVYDRLLRKRRQVTLRIPSIDRDRRKTTTATFANLIHQQDANIAMIMITKMVEMGIPTYTVHDNFITAGESVIHVPNLYIDTIEEVVNPLILIQFFITQNLKDSRVTAQYFDRPLSDDSLNDMLNKIIPEKLKSSQKKDWMEKKKRIIAAYKEYTYSLCTDKKCHSLNFSDNYHKKRRNFIKSLRKGGENQFAIHL